MKKSKIDKSQPETYCAVFNLKTISKHLRVFFLLGFNHMNSKCLISMSFKIAEAIPLLLLQPNNSSKLCFGLYYLQYLYCIYTVFTICISHGHFQPQYANDTPFFIATSSSSITADI